MNQSEQVINRAYHILLGYGINVSDIKQKDIPKLLDKIIEYNNAIISQKREEIKKLLESI